MNLFAFPEIELRLLEDLLARVEKEILNSLISSKSKFIYLEGKQGSGKSYFLKKLSRLLTLKNVNYLKLKWDTIKFQIEPFYFSTPRNSSLEIFSPFEKEKIEQIFLAENNPLYEKLLYFRRYPLFDFSSINLLSFKKEFYFKKQVPVILIDNLSDLTQNQKAFFKLLLEEKNFPVLIIATGLNSKKELEFIGDYLKAYSLPQPSAYHVYDYFENPQLGEFILKKSDNISHFLALLKFYFQKGYLKYQNHHFKLEIALKDLPFLSLEEMLKETLAELEKNKNVIDCLKEIIFREEPISPLNEKEEKLLVHIAQNSFFLLKKEDKYYFYSDFIRELIRVNFGNEVLCKEMIFKLETKYSQKEIVKSISLLNTLFYFYYLSCNYNKSLQYLVYLLKISAEKYFYTKLIFLEDLFLKLVKSVHQNKRVNHLIGRGYYYLSEAYFRLGEWKKTKIFLQRAFSYAHPYENKKLEYLIFSKFANLYLIQRDFRKVAHFLEQAREIALYYEDDEMLISIFNLYAEYKYRSSQYDEAKKMFEIILEDYKDKAKRKKIKIEYGRTLRGLGKLYAQEGDYFKALEFYEKSMAYYFEKQNPRDKVDLYQRLAITSLKLGQLEKAGIYLASAVMELASAGDLYLASKVLSSLSNFYLIKGEWSEAKASISNLFNLSSRIGNKFGVVIAYQLYFQFYLLQGDSSNIEKYAYRLKKYIENNGFSLKNYYFLMGKYHLFFGNYKKSVSFLEKVDLDDQTGFYNREINIMTEVYYLIAAFFLQEGELIEKNVERLKLEVVSVQDVYLLSLIYMGLFYYELYRKNKDYAIVLFKKMADNLDPFYKGLELLRVLLDLVELNVYPLKNKELLSKIKQISSTSFTSLFEKKLLYLDIDSLSNEDITDFR